MGQPAIQPAHRGGVLVARAGTRFRRFELLPALAAHTQPVVLVAATPAQLRITNERCLLCP